MKNRWLIWSILLSLIVYAAPAAAYEKPKHISDKVWSTLQPYLLPEDHEVKPVLDILSSQSRWIANYQAVKDAGFNPVTSAHRRVMVASHPHMKGYLVKAYLDTRNKFGQDWAFWKRRIDGARQIQACLDRHRYNHIMKVPKKWIYPLPDRMPKYPGAGPQYQNFVLVVEDMDIYRSKENHAQYKKAITPERLEALYRVLKENRLTDSHHVFNIPFCKDGKIAFLDTEFYNITYKSVQYKRLKPFLSTKMSEYWKRVYKGKRRKAK